MENYVWTSLDGFLNEVSSEKLKKLNDQIRKKQLKKIEIRRKLNDEKNQIKRSIIQKQLQQLYYEIEELRLKKRL